MSTPQNQAQSKSFFSALFDLDFKTFVTMRVLKVLYVLCIVFIGIASVGYIIGGLASGRSTIAVLALVFVPIAALISIIYVRLMFESTALFFRIGKNTEYLRDFVNAARVGAMIPQPPTDINGTHQPNDETPKTPPMPPQIDS